MVGCPFIVYSAQVMSQPDSVLLVMPIAGHAIRVRQVEEHIIPTSGKPFVTEGREKIIWRDPVGRMRIELLPNADRESHTGTITLLDPVMGALTILDPSSKTAVRVVGAVLSNQSGFLLPRFDTIVPTAEWTTATDSIEPRSIAGFMFTGTRITHVSPGSNPSTVIYEWWMSNTCGLIAEASATAFGETRRYMLAKYEWNAKMTTDVFSIPLDYTTQDIVMPKPTKHR